MTHPYDDERWPLVDPAIANRISAQLGAVIVRELARMRAQDAFDPLSLLAGEVLALLAVIHMGDPKGWPPELVALEAAAREVLDSLGGTATSVRPPDVPDPKTLM